MDPISIALGLLVLVGAFKVGVKATADGYATVKAAQSGAFDFIDADRQRKASQREKLASAWTARRAKRSREAGGDGTFRPGAREYGRDLWHGFWEDKLDRRAKTRAGRPEWVYDPDRKPWHVRFDEAVLDKVQRVRESRAWDKTKTAGRRLVEPVETRPAPTDPDPEVARADEGPDPASEQGGGEPDGGTDMDMNSSAKATWADTRGVAANGMRSGNTVTHNVGGRPVRPGVSGTSEGAVVAVEVNNNEDARRAFQEQINAANQAEEALSVYEAAQRRLFGVASAGLDGINGKRFDRQAQAAQANAADLLPASSMSHAAAAIEGIRSAAEAGLASLDKYRDAEQLVNDNNVDGKTLETAGSS